MLPALALIAQVVATPYQGPTDARPVRLWLGASPVTTGAVIPVYVSAATDGYLLVLRVGTDGRVDVVFPTDPQADGHVLRGAYELRAPGNRPALVATEGRGTGLVLAALSETPFRFREFASAGRWNRSLLVASYAGADGPGTLTDLAQRMLGDGWFNYDFALYTVRTEAQHSALQEARAGARGQSDVVGDPSIGVCNGCTIVYQTVSPEPVLEQTVIERTIVEPVILVTSLCEPFLGGCHAGRRRHHPRPAPPETTADQGAALTMRRASLSLSPVSRPAVPAPLPSAPPVPPVPAPATTSQRVVFISKPAPPVASQRSDRRRGERVAAAPASAPARGLAAMRGGTVRAAGSARAGAMTARQTGTALRAARLQPRRP